MIAGLMWAQDELPSPSFFGARPIAMGPVRLAAAVGAVAGGASGQVAGDPCVRSAYRGPGGGGP